MIFTTRHGDKISISLKLQAGVDKPSRAVGIHVRKKQKETMGHLTDLRRNP